MAIPVFQLGEESVPIHDLTSALDPRANYSVWQFWELCKSDETVAALAITLIVDFKTSKNPNLRPDEIRATGAEFKRAIQGAHRRVELYRSGKILGESPGQGQVVRLDPLPPRFVEMIIAVFRPLHKPRHSSNGEACHSELQASPSFSSTPSKIGCFSNGILLEPDDHVEN